MSAQNALRRIQTMVRIGEEDNSPGDIARGQQLAYVHCLEILKEELEE